MAVFPFYQVDAFSDRPLAGNACAIVFDADSLDASAMLAIAREMNLSETAFVRASDRADFGVRYFTPREEIPMAGHPTIATAYALAVTGRIPLTGPETTLTLELRVGPLQVALFAPSGVVEKVVMTQPKPKFLKTHRAETVMPLFGLTAGDVLPGQTIQTVSTGTPQLMAPVKDHEALKRARIDTSAYLDYRSRSDFFSPHLFCLGGVTSRGDTFARHLDTPPDILEDPFTGSATGGMAAYLWRYGLIDKPEFIAEQGHWMNRPGTAEVTVIGPPENIEAVKVGGAAVMVLKGELILPAPP